MQDVDAVLARQRDDFLEERQLDTLCRRVGRKVDDEHLRLRKAHLDRMLELGEEVHVGRELHLADVRACDHRAVDMNWIARVRHQHRVAATERGEREMCDAFLRADGDDRLRLGIELDVPATAVPLADGAAQARNAARDRVSVCVRTLHGFDELVDDVPGRWSIRVAHAEVDDVLPAAAGGHLELGGDVENVRRKALDARKLRFRGGSHTRSFCA